VFSKSEQNIFNYLILKNQRRAYKRGAKTETPMCLNANREQGAVPATRPRCAPVRFLGNPTMIALATPEPSPTLMPTSKLTLATDVDVLLVLDSSMVQAPWTEAATLARSTLQTHGTTVGASDPGVRATLETAVAALGVTGVVVGVQADGPPVGEDLLATTARARAVAELIETSLVARRRGCFTGVLWFDRQAGRVVPLLYVPSRDRLARVATAPVGLLELAQTLNVRAAVDCVHR
jgi:hypothetical protein